MILTRHLPALILALTLPGCSFLGLSKPVNKQVYCPTPDPELFSPQPTTQEPAKDGSAGQCLSAVGWAFENLREAERKRKGLEDAVRTCLDPKSPYYSSPENKSPQ